MNPQLKINLISILVAAIVVPLVILWRKFSIGRLVDKSTPQLADSEYDSAIISFYSAGHDMANATRSKLNGMHYSTYVTVPNNVDAFVDELAAICALDLPFNTGSHLVGLSKEHKIDRVQFETFLAANGMVKVVLEGDFPDYFDIYAPPGQDTEVRQVLNPEAMGFVVDFCRTHFWEINSSELYIVATDNDQGNESIIAESQRFVDQIKPALLPGEAGAATVHHAVPYGEYDGPALACPLCAKAMILTDNWMLCPDGHGVLINGRDILRLRHHTLDIPMEPSKTTAHGTITCPNCHNQMAVVNYQDTGIEIDSCEQCPYRWLDADEVTKLASKIV
jgi:Zn ribbon nucleic-acid-binding protein